MKKWAEVFTATSRCVHLLQGLRVLTLVLKLLYFMDMQWVERPVTAVVL